MVPAGRPAAEVVVDERLIQDLLLAQHPDLARLPVRVVGEGWDNVIARLGEDLVVRLPRRAVAARPTEEEIRWLPGLAPDLPMPVPVPLREGRPGQGYPWSWTVTRWVPGDIAARAPLADPAGSAGLLGGFLRALHRPAPPDAPVSPFRGIPLAMRDDAFHQAVTCLPPADRDRARRVWGAARAAQPWNGPQLWLHGDLHPANLLVRDGALAAVIDFGDLTVGDPACDLAVGWMLFGPHDREILLAASGHDGPPMRARTRGWALALSLAFLSRSSDDPVVAGIGRRTLDAVLRDVAPETRAKRPPAI